MQTIVTRVGLNHLAVEKSVGETWSWPVCGRNVETKRVTEGTEEIDCPTCREEM